MATDLRSGPDKGAPILGVLPPAVRVWASERASLGYRRVRTDDGAAGFASEGDVEMLPDADAASSETLPERREPGAAAVSSLPSGGAPSTSARRTFKQSTGTLQPAPVAASGASPAPQGYTVARIGALVPKHDDISGFDTGIGFEVGFGLAASPNLALEVSTGRYTMSGSASGYVSGFYVTLNEDVTVIPVMTTVKAIVGDRRLNLYALAGTGLYFISTKAVASSGYSSQSSSDSATAFGFHFGAGAVARIDDRLIIGAELKYIIANAKFYGVTTGLDSLIVGGMLGFTF